MLADAGATPRMRARLAELKQMLGQDFTMAQCARELGIKKDALCKSIYRAKLKRRAMEASQREAVAIAACMPRCQAPAKPPSPDEGPDQGREYAAFLLKTIERPGIGKSGGSHQGPEEGDRDRVNGKRVTVDDVHKVVKRLAEARAK